ncbi:MAG: hypothetical protein ACRENE_28415, partial [Polyangiaceae bacterium]
MAGLVAGCSLGSGGTSKENGSLLILLESDMAIPADIDHVRLVAEQKGHAKPLLSIDSDLGTGKLPLPASYHLNSDGDATPVTLRATAFKSGQALVEREAVTPIPSDRVGEVRISLDYACLAPAAGDAGASRCPAGQTCVQGACVSVNVTPTTVVGPDGGIVVVGSSSGGADAETLPDSTVPPLGCFDALQCFAAAVPAALNVSTCTVTLPAGVTASPDLDVAIQLPAGSSGTCSASACWVVLDSGDLTVAGSQVTLPASACTTASTQGGAIAVSSGCPSKVAAQTVCANGLAAAAPPSSGGLGSPLGDSCSGPTTQPCGYCGTQSRACNNGTW